MLKIKAFAMTSGLIWGVIVFITTWWLIAQQKMIGEPTFIGYIYPYYTVSPLGSIIGLVYGLVDGFVLGLLFAWLYNRLAAEKSIE